MDAELNPVPLVLMYHSVEAYEDDPYQVTVHPDRFERQLRWLRRCGLRGVSMTELLHRRRTGRGARLVGLTFDDGYADFAAEVLPALQRHGFGATVYVVAGALGGRNWWDDPGPRKSLMTDADVRRMSAAGIEIGSHSMQHVRLPQLADRDLEREVRTSRQILQEITGTEVAGFCYPYGAVGEREVRAVREAGYDYACAVSSSDVDGRHAIPRAFIGDRDNAPRLLAKMARYRLTVGRAA